MSDQTATVKVTFATGTVQVTPQNITMTDEGGIEFQQDSSGDSFNFAGFSWCPTTAATAVGIRDFSINIKEDKVELSDTHADDGVYSYMISVVNPQDASQLVWSPDPEITNEAPPTIAFQRS